MKNYNLQNQTLQEKLIHAMIGTIVVLVIIYCAILLVLVFSVIEQKQNALTIKDLTSKVSYLESSYANTISKINDNVLLANNFKRVDGSFAIRKDEVASFALLYAK